MIRKLNKYLELFQPSRAPAENRDAAKNEERMQRINQFKNAVLSDLIKNEMYSDQSIMNCIKKHMEGLAGIVSWVCENRMRKRMRS